MQTLHGAPALPADDEALVGRKTFQALTGFRSSAFYERQRTGRLPRPLKLSARCARWRAGTIRHYLADPLGWEQGRYAASEPQAVARGDA